MTAVEFEQLTEEEAEALLADRFCQLSEAGYPLTQALAIALGPETLGEQVADSRVDGRSEPTPRLADDG